MHLITLFVLLAAAGAAELGQAPLAAAGAAELSQAPLVGCPSGWHGHDKYCYWHSEALGTRHSAVWTAVADQCSSFHAGSQPVSVPDSDTLTFLSGLTGDVTWSWIGLSRGLRGDWSWADGADVDYTRWYGSEPSDGYHCAVLYGSGSSSSYQYWFSQHCELSFPFFCQIQPNSSRQDH